MILGDTSVWINHLRTTNGTFRELLLNQLVLIHPFVIGELACGNLKARKLLLSDLHKLPLAISATDEEVLAFIEERKLSGLGLGWIDCHLLASALLSNCLLWTLDRQLQQAAKVAGVKLHGRA